MLKYICLKSKTACFFLIRVAYLGLCPSILYQVPPVKTHELTITIRDPGSSVKQELCALSHKFKLEGNVWDHRKDINEYFVIPSSVIENIKEMKNEGKAAGEIEKKVSGGIFRRSCRRFGLTALVT